MRMQPRSTYLEGAFAPTIEEVEVGDLAIKGELPADFHGAYIRNGPNPRFAPLTPYVYPMDGDAMIHRVGIRDGQAQYTNRFVRTPALMCEEAAGQALWPGIMTGLTPGADRVGPALSHTSKDLPHSNIVRHGGRLLALGDSGSPFLLSPELKTVGRETFWQILPEGITGHPKIDPSTGEMFVFRSGRVAPFLTWSVIGRDGIPSRAETPVEGVTRPSVIHDMALTRNYVVIVLAPLFVRPGSAHTGVTALSWEPEHGTRIALVPRSGGPVRWVTTGPFWMWHTANAYDVTSSDGPAEVVMDYVRWSEPDLEGSRSAPACLARLTLRPDAGSAKSEVLADEDMEFPRVDDRSLTAPHQTIAACLTTRNSGLAVGDADTLAWYDTTTRDISTWHGGDDFAVGEQTYVPAADDRDNRRGYWVSIATDRAESTSHLLIVAAADPAAGPIATIELPRRVPSGQHGIWLPDDD